MFEHGQRKRGSSDEYIRENITAVTLCPGTFAACFGGNVISSSSIYAQGSPSHHALRTTTGEHSSNENIFYWPSLFVELAHLLTVYPEKDRLYSFSFVHGTLSLRFFLSPFPSNLDYFFGGFNYIGSWGRAAKKISSLEQRKRASMWILVL